ncbi:hypothetical protein [Streptomyces chartreusis]|uniref:hypothetical protein n=1 Tax=Streptomyces chartreusis TaxID=1969 RepID=UPI00142ECEAC|nr:hypothetical protein [Streptomyces chartreusis]
MSSAALPPSAASGLVSDAKKWVASATVVVTEAVQQFTDPDSLWGSGAEHLQTVAIAGVGVQLLVMGCRRLRRDVKPHVDPSGAIRLFRSRDDEGSGRS